MKREKLNKTLEQLTEDDFDGLMFFNSNKHGDVSIEPFTYIDPGVKVKPGAMGNVYDIIIFRLPNQQGEKWIREDRFEAVLVHPVTYMKRMIHEGWLGILGKKTSTSDDFIDDVEEQIRDSFEKLGLNYE